jgi:uncharacterized protein (TIGR02679 family)
VTPVPGWLADPALGDFWAVVARRLERRGRVATGTVRVAVTDAAVRRAVTGLTGRAAPGRQAVVDLAELDADLRRRAGLGLVRVVEELVGPVRDRPADRAARRAARQDPVAAAVDHWRCRPDLRGQPWVPAWAESLAGDGTILRRGVAGEDLVAALDLVARLVAGEFAGRRRTEVAARATGDAHALDEGRLPAALVVRALAARRGIAAPEHPAGRRDLWEEVGVAVDRVSTTCLIVGLVPDPGADPAAGAAPVGDPGRHRWSAAADAGDPVHVTGWDLDRTSGWRPHLDVGDVLVTENPTVLEAFARQRPGIPVVCVNGHPRGVVLELLARVRPHAALRCHGDFDVAGLHIVRRLVDACGVLPWRMSAADYRAAARPTMPALLGEVPETPWDPDLHAGMAGARVAVHEEVVLDDLLDSWPS